MALESTCGIQGKMSEESFDFICTTCDENYGKEVGAVRYCIECCGYCCQTCTDGHKLFPTLRSHNLLDISQGDQAGQQQTGSMEFPTERCRIHKGKVVDMYCQDHDDVGCSTCIATSHKSCPESSIYSIPDMIAALFKSDDTTHIRMSLKDMIESMTTIINSKETKLEVLREVKEEAIEQVEIFEKALISLIRKAAEGSKSDIVAMYQDLENEVLQDKCNVDSINDELKQSKRKLKKSEGNRAQRFVCTKLAEKKVKEADSLKTKHDLRSNYEVCLAFTPDQSLINYIQSLNSLGQVNVSGKREDFYRIIGEKDINIRTYDDSQKCYSFGCCLTPGSKLLVTDYNNLKLKLIDTDTMIVEDFCELDGYPHDVCCISEYEAVVTYYEPGRIQFVSLHHKMSPTRQVELPHKCFGITSKNGKLYMTDDESSLYVYSMEGTLLNAIECINNDLDGTSRFIRSRHITLNENGDKIFVGGGNKGLICFDGDLNHVFTSTDSDLKFADGVCVDGNGNIFVVGTNSHNVIQFNENGEKVGVIVQPQDEVLNLSSVCFHQELNRLFTAMENNDIVKMYELE